MAKTPLDNPRASFWRDQKIARAGKVTARRALEQDVTAPADAQRRVTKRMAARAYWTHPHPWSDKTPA